ncbi:MAG: bifunctional DNA primase/polymerase [Pseudonocardia sp.]|nr:bifunctional DNA primase/polymerase [Pseudonocardia sp.]
MTSRDPLLSAALVAAGRGWSVFPLVPGEKAPAVRGWEQRATTDRRQIYRWWASGSGFNVGIACGPSGLVVIDLDERGGEEPPETFAGARGGEDVFAMLASAAGASMPVDTYAVATPSGRHLYYRAPADHVVRNSAGALGWRVDIRAAGGYVVAAGSHREDGAYQIVRHRPVAALPEWLRSALTPRPRPPESPGSSAPELPRRRASAYVRAIVDGESQAVAEAQTGTRHDTLLAAARTLGRLVGGRELSEDTARVALLHAAAGHVGIDGCTPREIEQTITDGIAFGQKLPRRIGRNLHQMQHSPLRRTERSDRQQRS